MSPRAAKLGVGIWTAEFRTRGGGTFVGGCNFSRLSASPLRALDQTTTATVALPTPSPSSTLAKMLLTLRPWEHELHLYRNRTFAWCGPLVEPLTFGAEQISLTALDLSAWLDRRVSTDHQWTNTDLASIAETIVLDAMARDNSPGLTVQARQALTHGELDVVGDQFPRALDSLRDLAGRGLDWSMDGRVLRIGGSSPDSEKLAAPSLGVWDTRAFADIEASYRGSTYGSEFTVLGAADSTGVMAEGTFGGISQRFGLVQQVVQNDSLLDDASAKLSAEARWRFSNQDAPYIQSAPLSPNCPVDFANLIATATVQVRAAAGILNVSGNYRITQVDVEVGDDAAETVSVSLQPSSDPDLT